MDSSLDEYINRQKSRKPMDGRNNYVCTTLVIESDESEEEEISEARNFKLANNNASNQFGNRAMTKEDISSTALGSAFRSANLNLRRADCSDLREKLTSPKNQNNPFQNQPKPAVQQFTQTQKFQGKMTQRNRRSGSNRNAWANKPYGNPRGVFGHNVKTQDKQAASSAEMQNFVKDITETAVANGIKALANCLQNKNHAPNNNSSAQVGDRNTDEQQVQMAQQQVSASPGRANLVAAAPQMAFQGVAPNYVVVSPQPQIVQPAQNVAGVQHIAQNGLSMSYIQSSINQGINTSQPTLVTPTANVSFSSVVDQSCVNQALPIYDVSGRIVGYKMLCNSNNAGQLFQ